MMIWIGIALDKETETVHLASMEDTREDAMQSVLEQFGTKLPIYCIDCTTQDWPETHRLLREWTIEQVGEDISTFIIAKLVEEFNKL